MKKKRSLCVLFATLISVAYLIYAFSYFMKDADTTAEGIATMLVLPHLFVCGLGILMGLIGYLTGGTGLILASAILYCVSAGLFIMYAVFLVPSIVLAFIGYVKQKKLNAI